jgi:hypothetical protein
MKRQKTLSYVWFLIVLLCLAFGTLAARADSVTFSNTGGTFTSNIPKTKLNLTGSGLYAISGLAGFGISNTALATPCGACLGSVTLTTSTLASGTLNATGTGSIGSVATFNAGGAFTVSSSLGGGLVFSGNFSNASWTKVATGTWQFTGTIMDGTLTIGGKSIVIPTAVTVQLTTTGSGFTTNPNGSVSFANSGGFTNFPTPVAEPNSLILLGSGLGLVGALGRHRAMKRRTRSS